MAEPGRPESFHLDVHVMLRSLISIHAGPKVRIGARKKLTLGSYTYSKDLLHAWRRCCIEGRARPQCLAPFQVTQTLQSWGAKG